MSVRADLAVLLFSLGCSNAAARFDAFEDRQNALGASAGGAGGAGGAGTDDCKPPAPGDVQGPALLAIETSTSPGKAILFLGQVETPELDGQTAVKFSYKALDATDRKTKVGEPLVVGPYAIADDGGFDAPTGKSTLPGSANAILPGVPITSALTLHGTICGVATFYCGTVTGTVSAPIAGPATGQFGLTLLADESAIPTQPRYGCAEDALVEALE